MTHSIYSLVYFSELNLPPSEVDTEIERILKVARKNNLEKKITGVLIATDKHFVQYIEGNTNHLSELYKKLSADKRHKNLTIIHQSVLFDRKFPTWSMGFKKFDGNRLNFEKASLSKSETKIYHDLISGSIKQKIGFDFNGFLDKLLILENLK